MGRLPLKMPLLSRNRFYGHVPLEIGQLKVLEFIDLSTNKFSGEIPQSMSGLNFLAYLDLSNNNFSGRIPSGTQLQGFDISTYEGNAGLCGKPLTNIGPGDEPVDHIPPSFPEYEADTLIASITHPSMTGTNQINQIYISKCNLNSILFDSGFFSEYSYYYLFLYLSFC